jgi:riboflavin synthase
MFTGLIEDIGAIERVERGAGGARVTVRCGALDTMALRLGDSVAVQGACYTVIERSPGRFVFEASAESLARTTLARMSAGARVHLERAAQLGGRLDGHIVQGHVDGVGQILRAEARGDAWFLELRAPEAVARLLVPKGSVAINGVSLTINEADLHGGRFDVMIVPFTARKTALTALIPGDEVNLEADILGKYVLWLLRRGAVATPEAATPHQAEEPAGKEALDLAFLQRHGFV